MIWDAVIFDPLLPANVVYLLAALSGLAGALAIQRRLKGWPFRALVMLGLLMALLNPSIRNEDRAPQTDIVLVATDTTASNRLRDRGAMVEDAKAEIEAALGTLGGVELREVVIGDAPGREGLGTRISAGVARALGDVPASRLAGVILLTDGRTHDAGQFPDIGVPVHQLLTGKTGDWDRRLVMTNAPAFAIVGEPVSFTLKIEDQGDVPVEVASQTETEILVSIGGAPERRFRIPVGRAVNVPITLDHAGQNVMQFRIATLDGELTDRNNIAALVVNGIRDRLRVLLVSGEPHAGERTWRNLLKSDGAVDLVHFTILRPPNKQDGVPVTELSLIAFPTRELFLEKIDDFDLIIFDRYKRRGILPSVYLQNITRYVQDGGAVLISAGPDFAGADSIYRSPVADIMPGAPTARLLEGAFRPRVSDLGARHPVTRGLEGANADAEAAPTWGHWLRMAELEPLRGTSVLTGAEGAPLLMLDRVGEGRVALIASDHAWLWHRGFDGGGPQAELLRRLAHWMMKEPELEEEALRADAGAGVLTIRRTTLKDAVPPVVVVAPDGQETEVVLGEVKPGVFSADYASDQLGIFRLSDGELSTVVAMGPATPAEFEQTVADGAALAGAVEASRGGTFRLEEGLPDIRRIREGRVAAGRGWIGIMGRDAYETLDIRLIPLVSALAFMLMGMALAVYGWLREGR